MNHVQNKKDEMSRTNPVQNQCLNPSPVSATKVKKRTTNLLIHESSREKSRTLTKNSLVSSKFLARAGRQKTVWKQISILVDGVDHLRKLSRSNNSKIGRASCRER